MNNIVEIENYILSVSINFPNLDMEGYCVKNIYLTDLLYVFTHEKEVIIDKENKLFYIVSKQRITSIGIKLSDYAFEKVKSELEYNSLKSIVRMFDVLNNYA